MKPARKLGSYRQRGSERDSNGGSEGDSKEVRGLDKILTIGVTY